MGDIVGNYCGRTSDSRHYLLLVGPPDLIAFSFQYLVGIEYAMLPTGASAVAIGNMLIFHHGGHR